MTAHKVKALTVDAKDIIDMIISSGAYTFTDPNNPQSEITPYSPEEIIKRIVMMDELDLPKDESKRYLDANLFSEIHYWILSHIHVHFPHYTMRHIQDIISYFDTGIITIVFKDE